MMQSRGIVFMVDMQRFRLNVHRGDPCFKHQEKKS